MTQSTTSFQDLPTEVQIALQDVISTVVEAVVKVAEDHNEHL